MTPEPAPPLPAIVWAYDPARSASDATTDTGDTACVAPDGPNRTPWAAYHTAYPGPDSYHRTKRRAVAACEAALQRRHLAVCEAALQRRHPAFQPKNGGEETRAAEPAKHARSPA